MRKWMGWAAVALCCCSLAVRASGVKILFPTSASIRPGLYLPSASGDYAVFCLGSEAVKQVRQAGGVLEKGDCPDGHSVLLKPLFRATPLAPISLGPSGFTMNGHLLPNTKPKPFSRAGKPLRHADFGSFTEGLFAISDTNVDSFDSRYFGPIDPASIRFHARPLIQF